MTPKFTPGPWKIKKDRRISTMFEIVGPEIVDDYENYGFALADANLIASAPDLYAALETMLNRYVSIVESGDAGFWDTEQEQEVIQARQALSKARGEES